MFKDILRAIKLELNYIKENKITLFLYFFIPLIIVYLFGLITQYQIPWREDEYTFFIFYSPTILPLIILFISVQIITLRIVGERAPYGTLDRDMLAISKTGIFFGKYIANSLIVIIQAIIVSIMVIFLFKLKIMGDSIFIFVFLILLALIGLALGLLISVFSKTKEQAVQLVPFIILLLLIFSGTLVSLVSMPPTLKAIASNMPLTITKEALDKVINYGHGIQQLFPDICKLVIWIFSILFIGWIKFLMEKSVKREGSKIKKVFFFLLLIIVIGIFFFSLYSLLKPNWEKMTINDFKIDRAQDRFETYPYVGYTNEVRPLIKDKINFADSVIDSRLYRWVAEGQYLTGATLVLKVKDESALNGFKGSGTSLEKKTINGEEVFYYTDNIYYAGRQQKVVVYLWDENKFFFLTVGDEQLLDNIANQAVSRYPLNPTANKIKPTKEQIQSILSSLVR